MDTTTALSAKLGDDRDRRIDELEGEVDRLRSILSAAGLRDESSNVVEELQLFDRLSVGSADDLYGHQTGLFGQLIDAAPVQVYIKDLGFAYTYQNRAARERMGYPDIDSIGKVDSEVISDPIVRESVRVEDTRTLMEGRRTRSEDHWIDNRGLYRTNISTRYPIVLQSDPDQQVGVVSIATDESFEGAVNATSAVVELLVHDWVSSLLGKLHDSLQNLLAWKTEHAKTEIERQRAKDLLELVRHSDPDPTRIDEDYTPELFNGWVADTFLPIHFMEGYLRFLKWYMGDPNIQTIRDKELKEFRTFNLKQDVCRYMDELFKCLKSGFEGASVASKKKVLVYDFNHDEVPDNIELYGSVRLCRMLVFEQARNHNYYGDAYDNGSLTPLRMAASVNSDCVELAFTSAGEPISSEIRHSVFQRGVRGSAASGERKEGGTGFGLFFCRRIAELHGGSSSSDDEPPTYELLDPVSDVRKNVFVFRLRDITRRAE